jgi:hypothetical protein
MEIKACPNCGSRRIYQGRMGDGVLTGYTSRDVCRNCGYQGMPIFFDSEKEYKKFLESKSLTKKTGKKFKEEAKKKAKRPLKYERPLTVTILAFIMIFLALFTIYLYYSLIGFRIISWLWIYYIAVFSISAIILPYGFIKGRGWAWTIGGMLYALSIPVGLIFLYYLTRPHVKEYFGKT